MKLRFLTLISALVLSVVFANANTTRIAFLCDIHVTPGNTNEEKLREAVAEINVGNYDVCVLAGDLTNEGSDEQLLNVKSILDNIRKPFYIIPGNHENNWSQSACKTFNDLWGNDRFIAEVNDLIIVGSNCGPYMKMGDGHIKQEDLIWLDETLKQHPNKRVISVNHYPIMPDLDNWQDYVKVIEKYPTAVHLCGHYHTFKYYQGGGVDALINRALDMKNGNYGYTIIDVTNDSIKQWDKHLGEAPVLVNAFPIRKSITKLETQSVPVVNIDNEIDNETIRCVFVDNASIFTRAGVDDKNVYFGNSLGWVKAVERKSGKVLWQYKTNASLFSRPAVTDRMVIIPTADHRLLWLNKRNGKLIYEVRSQGAYVADGVIKDGILYQGGNKMMEAWDVKTMRPIWRVATNNYCQAAPTIDGNDIVFGAWDTYLRCVDIHSGELRWQWFNGKNSNMLGPGNVVPVIAGNHVITVAPDRYMTCLDRASGKEVWRVKDKKVRESLGCSADGKVAYAKTMDGEILAVDTQADSYTPLWCIDAGFGYEHAPCAILEHNGIIYAGSRNGKVVAIDAASHQFLWSKTLGNSEVNGFEVTPSGSVIATLIEGTVFEIVQ